MKSLKITTIIIAIIATFASCKKELPSTTLTAPNYYASKEYATKIDMRKKAQAILTEISTDRDVQEEILKTIDAITKKYYWRDEAVYFKEFLKDNYNTILGKPSITAQKFNLLAYKLDHPNYIQIASFLPGHTPGGGTSNNTLSNYLYNEDEEIYMPYHEDYVTTYNPTCTHQNLAISETSNAGTVKINNAINNRTVTDAFAQTNACWIVGVFDDNRQAPLLPAQPQAPSQTTANILNPTWVDLGYIKATDPHEGIFKGGPEFRLNATDITIFGNPATAVPTTEIAINMSRKEAKNGTQKRQWIILDQSWEILELNKRIEVYEDDKDGTGNNIKSLVFPLSIQLPGVGVIAVTAGKYISNKDEDLGHIPYTRTTYYNTNNKNADFGHGKDPDGWPYYYHGGSVWYSLPRLMN